MKSEHSSPKPQNISHARLRVKHTGNPLRKKVRESGERSAAQRNTQLP